MVSFMKIFQVGLAGGLPPCHLTRGLSKKMEVAQYSRHLIGSKVSDALEG